MRFSVTWSIRSTSWRSKTSDWPSCRMATTVSLMCCPTIWRVTLLITGRLPHRIVTRPSDGLCSRASRRSAKIRWVIDECSFWFLYHSNCLSLFQLNAIRNIFRFPSNSRRIQQYNSRLVFTSDMHPMEKALNPHLQSSALSTFVGQHKTLYNLILFVLALFRLLWVTWWLRSSFDISQNDEPFRSKESVRVRPDESAFKFSRT